MLYCDLGIVLKGVERSILCIFFDFMFLNVWFSFLIMVNLVLKILIWIFMDCLIKELYIIILWNYNGFEVLNMIVFGWFVCFFSFVLSCINCKSWKYFVIVFKFLLNLKFFFLKFLLVMYFVILFFFFLVSILFFLILYWKYFFGIRVNLILYKLFFSCCFRFLFVVFNCFFWYWVVVYFKLYLYSFFFEIFNLFDFKM